MSEPDQKAVHVRELVAFELFRNDPANPKVSEKTRDAWQAQEEAARTTWRETATVFLAYLGDRGLGVRVSDSKEVGKAIEFLLTVPPKQAYSLPADPFVPPAAPTIVLPKSPGFP